MTRIVLARHGETIWHDGNRYAGRTDVTLSEHGRVQALWLAEWAASAALDGLWCSTLGRARATAEPAARATGLALHEDARLCEIDFGRAEGLTVAEMEQRFPDALRAFRADPVAHHLPGGEDPRAVLDRALACLGEIAAAHPAGRVLVVAHTTLIRLVLCHLLGLPLAAYRRVFPFVRNVALTELAYDGGAAGLVTYNAPLDRAGVDGAGPDAEWSPGITR